MSSHLDKKNDVNIEYDSEEQKIGMYADVTRIGMSPNTFSFEFAQALPPQANQQKPIAKMMVRIVMSPEHAKLFFNLFKENLQLFESIKDKEKSITEKSP